MKLLIKRLTRTLTLLAALTCAAGHVTFAATEVTSDALDRLLSCAQWEIWIDHLDATPKEDLLKAMRTLGDIGPDFKYISHYNYLDPTLLTFRTDFERDFFQSANGAAAKERYAQQLLPLSGVVVRCYVDPHSGNGRGSLSN